MERLNQFLAERGYKQALLYLWCLARAERPGGGSCFDAWSLNLDEDKHHLRVGFLVEAIESGDGAGLVESPEGTDALAWISALDRVLANEIGNKRRQIDRPLKDPSGSGYYWILARRPRSGYLYKTPTKLAWFHPNHILLPATLHNGKTALVSGPSPQQAWLETQGPWRSGIPERLRIAVVSFDDGCVLQAMQRGRGVFYQALVPEAERLDRAREAIRWAEGDGVDILLFPELTLPGAIREQLTQELLDRAAQKTPSSLKLIGLGSFHEEEIVEGGTAAPRNRAYLVAGRDGRELLRQDKFVRASYQNRDESFLPGERVGFLTSVIGLVALAICKDLFDEEACWIWRQLSPDWLLVPSMSNDLKRHLEHTADLWKRHGCVSLVANQCIEPTEPHPWSYIHCKTDQHADRHLKWFDVLL